MPDLTFTGLDASRSTVSLDGRLPEDPIRLEDCLALTEADESARFAMIEADDYRACVPLVDLLRTGTVQVAPEGIRVVVGGARSRCWSVKRAHTIRLLVDAEPDTVPVVSQR